MTIPFQRVLLTGANGLVGQALVEHLSTIPEVDLLATSREHRPRLDAYAGGYTSLDVTDQAAVRRLFVDFEPATVVHCAALSKVGDCEADREGCWDLNVHATETLARTCRAHGARLVLMSTDFIFDGEDGPYAEDAHPAPINFYGRSKLAAENAVRTAGRDRWAIVRTTMGYGDASRTRRGNIASWLIERLKADQKTDIPADQIRTPTYIHDLADGIARLVFRRRSGVYHISGRESISVFEFARRIAAHFDLDPELISPTTTAELHPDAPRPLKAGLLILKAETELGFRPRPIGEALDDLARRAGIPVASS